MPLFQVFIFIKLQSKETIHLNIVENIKQDEINKGELRSNNTTTNNIYNWKQLMGWVKGMGQDIHTQTNTGRRPRQDLNLAQ